MKIDQDAIDLLESLLDYAKKGEITAIIFGALNQDGEVATSWTGIFNDSQIMALGTLRKIEIDYIAQSS